MLDDRPIVQKSLIGAGAFAFVFLAAMSGTAFMLTGGIDFSDEHPAHHQTGGIVNVVRDAWSDWAVPESEARIVPASLSEQVPDEPFTDPQPATSESLEGDGAQRADITTPVEDWINQNAEVQYAANDDSAADASSDEDKIKSDADY